ncbi:MAG: CrcB family protein [Phycisphaerales bacterium]|nr:CrcB family protein [Phycisphaerales bacterium]
MKIAIAVAVGGACGALLRESIMAMLQGVLDPWVALLCVNVPGSIAIGLLLVALELRFHKAGGSALKALPLAEALRYHPGLFEPDPTMPATELNSLSGRGKVWSGLLITGLLGGFTTFSTFSFDLIELLRNGEIAAAAVDAAISFVACVAGVIAGMSIQIRRAIRCTARTGR